MVWCAIENATRILFCTRRPPSSCLRNFFVRNVFSPCLVPRSPISSDASSTYMLNPARSAVRSPDRWGDSSPGNLRRREPCCRFLSLSTILLDIATYDPHIWNLGLQGAGCSGDGDAAVPGAASDRCSQFSSQWNASPYSTVVRGACCPAADEDAEEAQAGATVYWSIGVRGVL